MSNPSQEKAPTLKWEQAKEDNRNLSEQTPDQATQAHLQNSVHEARIEQAKPKEKESTMLKGSVAVEVRIDNGHGHRFKIEKVKSVHSGTSCPDAQMSHDAKGKLHHVDFKPNKDR